MKIILLKDVAKVGKRYEIRDISDGYALNLLIPRGLAVAATPTAVRRVEEEKKRLSSEQKVQDDLLSNNLKALSGAKITISAKASEAGHLFAGIHPEQIVSEVKNQLRVDIDKSFIVLESPIKKTGAHAINVKAGNRTAIFSLDVNGSAK